MRRLPVGTRAFLRVADIIKLLEKIPIWRTLTSLPRRLAELEQKVAALEAAANAYTRKFSPSKGYG